MADTYYPIDGGFFNAVYNEETNTYDRQYDAADMNMPYKRIVSDGIFGTVESVDNEGDVEETKVGNDFQVTIQSQSDRTLIVARGNAIINSRWCELEQNAVVDVPPNANMSDRVDSVILQFNNNLDIRSFRLVYRTGTNTTTPPALTTATEQIKELRLANVIAQGTGKPNPQIQVTDTRGTNDCPLVTGFLQQLSLEQRLSKFDQDVTNKINQYDSQLRDKLTEYDNAWDAFFGTSNTTGVQGTWSTWYTATQSAWNTWFGASESAGIRKTWSDWLSSTQSAWNTWYQQTQNNWSTWNTQTQNTWNSYYSGVQSSWNTWFGTDASSGVQKTWNDWYTGVQSAWTAYLSGRDDAWATYISGKDSAWTTYLSGKDTAWDAWFNGIKAEWDAFFSNVSADIGVKVWNGYYDATAEIAANGSIAWTSFAGGNLTFSTYTYSATRDTVYLYKNGFKLRGNGKEFSISSTGVTLVNKATAGATFEVVIYRTAEPVQNVTINVE